MFGSKKCSGLKIFRVKQNFESQNFSCQKLELTCIDLDFALKIRGGEYKATDEKKSVLDFTDENM